jgi:hypothetical protein
MRFAATLINAILVSIRWRSPFNEAVEIRFARGFWRWHTLSLLKFLLQAVEFPKDQIFVGDSYCGWTQAFGLLFRCDKLVFGAL